MSNKNTSGKNYVDVERYGGIFMTLNQDVYFLGDTLTVTMPKMRSAQMIATLDDLSR